MLIKPAGSNQQVFILSVTDLNPAIWSDSSQTNLGLGIRNHRTATRDIYLWNMHLLASQVGSPTGSGDGFYTVSADDPNWKALWPSSFNYDSGKNVFKNVKTDFAVAPFNHPVAGEQIYSGSLQFSPLIIDTTNANGHETIDGEDVVWQSMVFPGYPLLLALSYDDSDRYGPVFITSATIEVTGQSKLSPVNINLSWQGGKSIVSPTMTVVDPIYDYRTASLYDCMFANDVFVDYDSLFAEVNGLASQEKTTPEFRVIGMKLNIRQSLKFTNVQQDNGFTDEQGPTYVAVQDRTVTGSITVFSKLEDTGFQNDGPLTMYFGNNLLFPMPNVDWQNPTGQVQAGQGFITTYEFIATAATDAVVKGFNFPDNGYPVSEFAYVTPVNNYA